MVPSSSGLGRLVLIQKIAGSTPAGITNLALKSLRALFYLRAQVAFIAWLIIN